MTTSRLAAGLAAPTSPATSAIPLYSQRIEPSEAFIAIRRLSSVVTNTRSSITVGAARDGAGIAARQMILPLRGSTFKSSLKPLVTNRRPREYARPPLITGSSSFGFCTSVFQRRLPFSALKADRDASVSSVKTIPSTTIGCAVIGKAFVVPRPMPVFQISFSG